MAKKRARIEEEEGEAGEKVEGTPVKKKSKLGNAAGKPLSKLLDLLDAESSLLAGLAYFLKTVTEAHEEDANQAGADLACSYLARYPDCHHLLAPLLWDRDRRSHDVLLLCFSCLEQVLLLTAALPTSATPTVMKQLCTSGRRLVQRLISSHMKSVYHCLLSAVPARLTGACLRLLAAMVMQGADSAREVQLVFNFGYKPLGTFPGKTTPTSDSSTGGSESIRQSYMKFALSFLIVGDATVITSALELKGFLSSFFKLLPKDDIPTAHLFLVTILEKVVLNTDVSKKAKSQFFNQFALKHIFMLLSPSDSTTPLSNSGDEPAEHVRMLARQLLDVLCTDHQLGICYRPKGGPAGLERTNNPVLLHFLLSLSGQLKDPAVRDFVIRTLKCSPDLLITYLRSFGITSEPQPSSQWVLNMTFLIKLCSEFTSVTTLLSGEWGEEGGGAATPQSEPSPDLVGVAVSLTMPSVITRSHLSLGLQHPFHLIKYYTLKLISIALSRAGGVVDAWGPVNRNLKSISSFLVRYSDCVLKCLPDVRTVIALRQRLQQSVAGGGKLGGREGSKAAAASDTGGLVPEDLLKNKDLSADPSPLSLLTLAVLRGLQKLSPDLLCQVNFSPAKLLPPFPSPAEAEAQRSVRGQQEVCLALQINLEASGESLCQNRDALDSVLMLVQSRDQVTSELARRLMRKVMQGWSVEDSDTLVLSTGTDDTGMFVCALVCLYHTKHDEQIVIKNLRGVAQLLLTTPPEDQTTALIIAKLTADVVARFRSQCPSEVVSILEPILKSRDESASVVQSELCTDPRAVATPSTPPTVRRGYVANVQTAARSLFRSRSLVHHAAGTGGAPLRGNSIPVPSNPVSSYVSRSDANSKRYSLGVMLSCLSKSNVHSSEIMGDSACSLKGMSPLVLADTLICDLLESRDWNKFVVSLLKSRFRSCHDLQLLSCLLPLLYGHAQESHTPLEVIYDMVWSHSEFIDVLRLSSDQNLKECLVELLVSIVELQPSVCKESHILAFLGAYSATQSKSDRGLLYLLHKYEECGVPTGEYSPFLWGVAALERHSSGRGMYWCPPDLGDVLGLLDTHTLLRTCSAFSARLGLEPQNPFLKANSGGGGDETLYDSCFLLPLFSHYLSMDAHVDCRLFVGHGVFGFLATALSSLQRDVRLSACHCLTRFRGHLEESRFREKPQILLLMDVLQNTLSQDCQRLPSVLASFVCKASLLLLHADDPSYPVVARHIVHKPAFDLRKVPLLHTMLHSSSPEAAAERVWLLKVLADGLRCGEDCRFYERQQVFSHVASLAGSDMLGRQAKDLVERILKAGYEGLSGGHMRTEL